MARNISTILIAILCLIITFFAWTSDTETIFKEYGYSTDNLLSGNVYVLITSIFLHSNLDHLFSNLLVLLIFGLALEEEIGTGRYLLLFFSGAFLGDLMSSLIYAPAQISVGASAGIFAIMAAAVLIKPIKMEVFVPIPLGIIGMGYIIYAIMGFIFNYPPNVSHIAHLGGAFVGLFYGCRTIGAQKSVKILIALLLIFLFVPIIWTFWALIASFILSLL